MSDADRSSRICDAAIPSVSQRFRILFLFLQIVIQLRVLHIRDKHMTRSMGDDDRRLRPLNGGLWGHAAGRGHALKTRVLHHPRAGTYVCDRCEKHGAEILRGGAL